jgi:hypothetical protein
MKSLVSCEICRYWIARDDLPSGHENMGEGFGECRRRSPHGGTFATYTQQAKTPKRVSVVAFPFPPTHSKDWCGEFEPPTALAHQ